MRKYHCAAGEARAVSEGVGSLGVAPPPSTMMCWKSAAQAARSAGAPRVIIAIRACRSVVTLAPSSNPVDRDREEHDSEAERRIGRALEGAVRARVDGLHPADLEHAQLRVAGDGQDDLAGGRRTAARVP